MSWKTACQLLRGAEVRAGSELPSPPDATDAPVAQLDRALPSEESDVRLSVISAIIVGLMFACKSGSEIQANGTIQPL